VLHRLITVFALIAAAVAAPAARADELVERGAYLARLMDCGGCHTWGSMTPEGLDESRALAGGTIGFEIPGLGVFFPPNLTPDMATGLGSWSAEDIANAVRAGVRPDGRELAPIMAWRAYAVLTDDDMAALAAYLKSLPPYSFQAPGPFGPSETATAPFMRVIVPQ
jgi:cytochrome c553